MPELVGADLRPTPAFHAHERATQRKEALGRQARGLQALLAQPRPPPQARPRALKRSGDISLSLSPTKRVCTSPLAHAEGRPVGADGSRVSWQGGQEAAGREWGLGQL